MYRCSRAVSVNLVRVAANGELPLTDGGMTPTTYNVRIYAEFKSNANRERSFAIETPKVFLSAIELADVVIFLG